MLEIADRRLYARCPQVFSVPRVANQPDDIVAAIDEQPRESDRDLPVALLAMCARARVLTTISVHGPLSVPPV